MFDILATIDPEFFKLKYILEDMNLNPLILIPIARSLCQLAIGTGYGKIQIQMTNRKITLIRGEENIEINETVIIDKENNR